MREKRKFVSGILVSYLLINAWTDWKKREVHMIYTIVFGMVGVVYKFILQEGYDWRGVIPGFILLLISFVWKNHIGVGDGIIVLFLGLMCGIVLVSKVLMIGFLMATSVGIICCIKEKRRDVELPFVPFILGSYVLELWI